MSSPDTNPDHESKHGKTRVRTLLERGYNQAALWAMIFGMYPHALPRFNEPVLGAKDSLTNKPSESDILSQQKFELIVKQMVDLGFKEIMPGVAWSTVVTGAQFEPREKKLPSQISLEFQLTKTNEIHEEAIRQMAVAILTSYPFFRLLQQHGETVRMVFNEPLVSEPAEAHFDKDAAILEGFSYVLEKVVKNCLLSMKNQSKTAESEGEIPAVAREAMAAAKVFASERTQEAWLRFRAELEPITASSGLVSADVLVKMSEIVAPAWPALTEAWLTEMKVITESRTVDPEKVIDHFIFMIDNAVFAYEKFTLLIKPLCKDAMDAVRAYDKAYPRLIVPVVKYLNQPRTYKSKNYWHDAHHYAYMQLGKAQPA